MLSRRLIFVALSAASLSGMVYARGAGQSPTRRHSMDGEQLFRSYCAPCHGEDAKGRRPAASALKTPPADLTSIARRNAGTCPRDRVARDVANGKPLIAAHGSKEMPIWGPNFAALALASGSDKPIEERIDAVVAYVQSIQTEK